MHRHSWISDRQKKNIVNHLKPFQYRWCRASQDLMGDVHVGRGPEAVPPAQPLLGLVLTCSLMVEAPEAPRSDVTCLRSQRSEPGAQSSLHHQVPTTGCELSPQFGATPEAIPGLPQALK